MPRLPQIAGVRGPALGSARALAGAGAAVVRNARSAAQNRCRGGRAGPVVVRADADELSGHGEVGVRVEVRAIGGEDPVAGDVVLEGDAVGDGAGTLTEQWVDRRRRGVDGDPGQTRRSVAASGRVIAVRTQRRAQRLARAESAIDLTVVPA